MKKQPSMDKELQILTKEKREELAEVKKKIKSHVSYMLQELQEFATKVEFDIQAGSPMAGQMGLDLDQLESRYHATIETLNILRDLARGAPVPTQEDLEE